MFLLGASHRNSTVEGSRKNRARGEAPPPLAARATRETSFVIFGGACKRPAPSSSAHPGLCVGTPPFLTPGTRLPTVRSTHTGCYQARHVRAMLMMQDLAETPPSICQLAAVPCSTSCVRSARRGPHRRFPAHRTAQTLFSPVRGAGVPQPLVAGGS